MRAGEGEPEIRAVPFVCILIARVRSFYESPNGAGAERDLGEMALSNNSGLLSHRRATPAGS
jgi:hypothetical protein